MSDTIPAFCAYQAVVKAQRLPIYFIESTAPCNVDDTASPPSVEASDLKLLRDADMAVADIAANLVKADEANLVIMVHGFNNPQKAVVNTYRAATQAIASDPAIRIGDNSGLVCVGYRWPSERMGTPISGSWDALPTLPTWVLYLGLALVLLSFPLFYWIGAMPHDWARRLAALLDPVAVHVVVMIGWTLAGLILTAVLLRTIVYFRDNFRAMNYGVPDLIQIVRAIDAQLDEQIRRLPPEQRQRPRVQLSFIGHSMGGFVVTNAIRSLSDLFREPVTTLDNAPPGRQSQADEGSDKDPSAIGKHLRLSRFVLASPDIPAEALLSGRGNFLASSLYRVKEAYLFSNEGDEVLRQISTLANYFVFPTGDRDYGFRLGNVEILSRDYGLIAVPEEALISRLRVGYCTVQKLHDQLARAASARARAFDETGDVVHQAVQAELPKVFTYFDCTDYVDKDRHGTTRPLLTRALRKKSANPNARLPWYSHLRLLIAYLVRTRPNVHGGYFEGELGQRLIYRLACLGYQGTLKAFGSQEALGRACAEKQIRVLLSPRLGNGT